MADEKRENQRPERDNPDSLKDKRKNVDPNEADREQTDSERTKLDGTHGRDPIEIERNEGSGLSDMDKYAPADGDLGDESEDFGDEAQPDTGQTNRYDSAQGVGSKNDPKDPQNPEGMHITKGGKAGLAAGKEDSYVDEEGKKKIAREKLENQEEVQNPGNKKE